MDWLIAGALLVGAVAVGTVFGTAWSTIRLRPQAVVTPLAVDSPPPAGEAVRVSASKLELELLERVEKLERTFPEWLVAMESMADQARELLDQADRKRRSVVQAERRAAATRENASGSANDDQPPLDAGMSVEWQRKQALRAVKARRGW